LVPCERLKSEEETNCITRKNLSTRDGATRRKTQKTATINNNPAIRPTIGDITINDNVPAQPFGHFDVKISDPNPAFEIAAPAYPPISAWEELVGSPRYQVIRFQETAPTRPASTTH